MSLAYNERRHRHDTPGSPAKLAPVVAPSAPARASAPIAPAATIAPLVPAGPAAPATAVGTNSARRATNAARASDTTNAAPDRAGSGAQSFAPRLTGDVAWNMASLAWVGAAGLLLNGTIALAYDAATLGVFNQVYAVFVLLSQFAVGGIHYSALKHTAEMARHPRRLPPIVVGAVLATIPLALASGAALWFARGGLARLVDSPALAVGLALAVPGLAAFALNKVLLAVLNGTGWLRLYAALQAARMGLLVGSVVLLSALGASGAHLAVSFSIAEGTLLGVLAVCCARYWRLTAIAGLVPWARRHLDFGLRSISSGLLVELNSRVDVLMLALFATDAVVGVYSFAAMLAEGLAQLPVALRTVVNPRIAALYAAAERSELARLVHRGRRLAWGLVTVAGLSAVAVFPLAAWLVEAQPVWRDAWLLFTILAAGIVLASPALVFQQVLLVAGRPGWHSLMMLGLVLTNVAANSLLIPLWGAAGAAAATALTLVVSIGVVRHLAWRLTAIRL